jgi:hypothetical protein
MTVQDFTRSDDERAAMMHGATDDHVKALMITWGMSRKAALEHLIAFAENDEESPAFTTRAGPPRKRRVRAEALA